MHSYFTTPEIEYDLCRVIITATFIFKLVKSFICRVPNMCQGFPHSSVSKSTTCNAEDPGQLIYLFIDEKAWHDLRSVHVLSHVCLSVTSWTVARQAPLSMKFSRQEYWSGLSFPSQGDLPDPGIKPASLESPALAGGFFYH